MQAAMTSNPYINQSAPDDPFKNSYRENEVFTASREELVLMLYDGALKFMRFGLLAIEENDRPKVGYHVLRAQKIIHYLDMSLDMDAGKEVAQNLSNLYDYVNRKLFECQRHRQAEPLEAAKQVIETLREAWSIGVVKKED